MNTSSPTRRRSAPVVRRDVLRRRRVLHADAGHHSHAGGSFGPPPAGRPPPIEGSLCGTRSREETTCSDRTAAGSSRRPSPRVRFRRARRTRSSAPTWREWRIELVDLQSRRIVLGRQEVPLQAVDLVPQSVALLEQVRRVVNGRGPENAEHLADEWPARPTSMCFRSVRFIVEIGDRLGECNAGKTRPELRTAAAGRSETALAGGISWTVGSWHVPAHPCWHRRSHAR